MPQYYKCLGPKYNTVEVVQNDYLCKSGDYSRLIDFILTNTESIDYLILLDCKGNQDLLLNDLVLNIAVCRDYEMASRFKLQDSILLVDSYTSGDELSEDVLTWEDFKFKPEDTTQYKFVQLSAKTTVMKLLDRLEDVFGGI